MMTMLDEGDTPPKYVLVTLTSMRNLEGVSKDATDLLSLATKGSVGYGESTELDENHGRRGKQ